MLSDPARVKARSAVAAASWLVPSCVPCVMIWLASFKPVSVGTQGVSGQLLLRSPSTPHSPMLTVCKARYAAVLARLARQ